VAKFMLLRATALLVSLMGLSLFEASAQTESNRSTVYGRAVSSDTEKPVGHANVVLRSVRVCLSWSFVLQDVQD
jgi:hypothetical protein